jgi:hypothetical protein
MRKMRSTVFTASACVAIAFAISATEKVAGTFPRKVPATFSVSSAASNAPVAVLPLAGDGIQPQAAVDASGTIHVVFFRGQASGGDLYYAKLGTDGHNLSEPVRVNSIEGSALATGSVRGAQMALGRNGYIHIAWHGSKAAGEETDAPMWYSRSADGVHFEAQRTLSGESKGLDGGSVAADLSGHVAIVWHGMGTQPGENHRTVYITRSSDDGASFAAVAPATPAPVGACGCCGMRALFDREGALHVLYRAATDGTHRDTTWLMIQGATPRPPVRVDPWDLQTCPMSTFALAESSDGLVAAWETAQQVFSATLNPKDGSVGLVVSVPGKGSRKHPTVAVNARGDRLLAWAEGTAWNRGGTVAWRLTDRNGKEMGSSQNAGPVPMWGLVSAVTLRNGSFVILR